MRLTTIECALYDRIGPKRARRTRATAQLTWSPHKVRKTHLKAKYDQLKVAGKAPKVAITAITAIMRKLVVLANALLKVGRKWQPALT
jgi:hypothetical protein